MTCCEGPARPTACPPYALTRFGSRPLTAPPAATPAVAHPVPWLHGYAPPCNRPELPVWRCLCSLMLSAAPAAVALMHAVVQQDEDDSKAAHSVPTMAAGLLLQ